MNVKNYKNCKIDLDNKIIFISKGSTGEYSCMKIKKIKIVYEDARFTGKSIAFSHKMLIHHWQPMNIFEGKVYVGIQLEMEDKSKKYLYVSDNSCVSYSSNFNSDNEEAEKINNILKEINHTNSI